LQLFVAAYFRTCEYYVVSG